MVFLYFNGTGSYICSPYIQTVEHHTVKLLAEAQLATEQTSLTYTVFPLNTSHFPWR